MKRSAVAFALLAALALSGCVTLGPDYEEPDVTWLNDWQSDLYGQIGQARAADPRPTCASGCNCSTNPR